MAYVAAKGAVRDADAHRRLSALVLVDLDEAGHLVHIGAVKASGDDLFDGLVQLHVALHRILGREAHLRSAPDDRQVASTGLQALLAMEVKEEAGTATDSGGDRPVGRADGPGESHLGV